ncbi:hypothetical protein A9Q74_06200 [Colwellia sp. 39_35_sub15_T18]|nr:hypothetical protein A9Q74_06200 [Colwellia sp. 39_35_sub15_T18]
MQSIVSTSTKEYANDTSMDNTLISLSSTSISSIASVSSISVGSGVTSRTISSVGSAGIMGAALAAFIAVNPALPLKFNELISLDSSIMSEAKEKDSFVDNMLQVKSTNVLETTTLTERVAMENDLVKKEKILKLGVNISSLGCILLVGAAVSGILPALTWIPGAFSAAGVLLSCGIQLNKVDEKRKGLST